MDPVLLAWVFGVPGSDIYRTTWRSSVLVIDRIGRSAVGATYLPSTMVPGSVSFGGGEVRGSVGIPMDTAAERTFWLSEPGHAEAMFGLVHSSDGGATWTRGFTIRGRLDQPQVEGGDVSVDIVSGLHTGEPLPQTWSHDYQTSRFPNDSGFARLLEAERSDILTGVWP